MCLTKTRKTGTAHMEARTTPQTGCALGAPRKELQIAFATWRRAAVPFVL
jgi:hypothetical protein